jgi:potassium voltage-gated channel Shaw-related subfamily C protein
MLLNVQQDYTMPHPAFFYVDLVCNIFFSFELLARVIFCPNVRHMASSILTIIDIVATASFYIDWVVQNNVIDNNTRSSLEIIEITCILRLFKLTQHFSGLKILIQTFKASAQE